jgi:hypothetical protein
VAGRELYKQEGLSPTMIKTDHPERDPCVSAVPAPYGGPPGRAEKTKTFDGRVFGRDAEGASTA